MNLTCAQMDVLISFYIDDELSSVLKKQVEEHLKNCATCRAKYDIIKTMICDLKTDLGLKQNNEPENLYKTQVTSKQYGLFKNNLSAYIDNELSIDENVKIKKFTINNIQARKDLEDSYNIRKLMNDSFNKTKTDAKQDFSKNILKKLEIEKDDIFVIHPAIKILSIFTISVLILTSIVLISLSV